MGGAFILAIVIGLAIGLTIAILYLLNIQDALKEVAQENIQVPPVNTWLLLIPLFNIVYAFIFYPKMAESFKREFESRGLPKDGDFGKTLGVSMAIVTAVRILPIAVIEGLLSLAGLILLIVLWVKVAKYKTTLRTSPKTDFDGVSNNTSDLLDN